MSCLDSELDEIVTASRVLSKDEVFSFIATFLQHKSVRDFLRDCDSDEIASALKSIKKAGNSSLIASFIHRKNARAFLKEGDIELIYQAAKFQALIEDIYEYKHGCN